MYIRRSEDVQDVFWTSYVRSIYVLCLLGTIQYLDIWRQLIGLPIILACDEDRKKVFTDVPRCVKYRNFTEFPGVEILRKGTVSA